jgi:DHA3 family macrolide efflux protein-like MFS transporter
MTAQDKQPPSSWKRTFFTIWTGQNLSAIGSALAGFALIWWLTESTGSAIVLSTATLVAILPGVLLGPIAGALVDRWNRRLVMLVADGLIALFSAWLVYLFWADTLQLWHVYVIMVARAIGMAFHMPAMQASTPLLVPDEHLARVQGLNSTMTGILNIAAPPLGALLTKVLPLHGVMAIDVISAAFAIAPLLFVDIPQPTRKTSTDGKPGRKPSLLDDLREGLSYIWHWPGLRATLLMAVVVNLALHPSISLVPILVSQRFGGGPVQVGWMSSAWGLGMILGGLALGAWGGFRRRIVTTLVGLIGMGIGALVVGLSPTTSFGLALGAYLFFSFAMPITNGPLIAIYQSVIPPEMQGRVFAALVSVSQAMAPLGMVIAGPTADKLGVHTWFLLSGAACVLMAVVGSLTPAVIHIEENYQKKEGLSAPVFARANTGAE